MINTNGCQSCMYRLTTVDHLPYNYGQMVSALLGLISTVQLHGMIMHVISIHSTSGADASVEMPKLHNYNIKLLIHMTNIFA